MHYIGHEILATRDDAGFKFWNISTGALIDALDIKYGGYSFLPDLKMAYSVYGCQETGIKIVDLRSMNTELYPCDCSFDALDLSNEGVLVCSQNISFRYKLRFFNINGLKLTEMDDESEISGIGKVHLMRPLPDNLIALSLLHNECLKIFDISNKTLKYNVDIGSSIGGFEAISKEYCVVLVRNGFKMISLKTGLIFRSIVETDFGSESNCLFTLNQGEFGVLGLNRIYFHRNGCRWSSVVLTKFHYRKQVECVIGCDRGRFAVASNGHIKITDFKADGEPSAKRFKCLSD